MERLFVRYFGVTALVVGPGMKTGLAVLYENPRDVGADSHRQRGSRLCALAAGSHRGGLWHGYHLRRGHGTRRVRRRRDRPPDSSCRPTRSIVQSARLPRVEIARPKHVVGTNTVASIQSGLVFGYAGMVDALVNRIRAEIDYAPKVVATGGLSALVARESSTIEECDELLTLRGLRILFERNHV